MKRFTAFVFPRLRFHQALGEVRRKDEEQAPAAPLVPVKLLSSLPLEPASTKFCDMMLQRIRV